jgi:hypothetical protein
MLVMKKSFLLITCIAIFIFANSACKKKCIPIPNAPVNNYISFGHFFGLCVGEGCIENFKIDDNGLWEDVLDKYPNGGSFYVGNYVSKPSNQLAAINALVNNIPAALLADSNVVIGKPDAGDWGGVYFEINKNGVHKFWLLDNMPIVYDSFRNNIKEAIKLAQ